MCEEQIYKELRKVFLLTNIVVKESMKNETYFAKVKKLPTQRILHSTNVKNSENEREKKEFIKGKTFSMKKKLLSNVERRGRFFWSKTNFVS